MKYTGPTWPAFQSGTMTVVQPSTVVITQYVLVDVVNNTTFVRPASSDGADDVPEGASDVATAPAPVTPTPAPATPSPTTDPAVNESGREGAAIALMQDRYRGCSAAAGDEPGYAEEVISGANFDASPTGTAIGEYQVTASDATGTFQFWVNVDTGSVAASNADAQALADYCPGAFD